MSAESAALDLGDGRPGRLRYRRKIVDRLNHDQVRPNTLEEVRQVYGRKLYCACGYPQELMAFGAPINIGREPRGADIVIIKTTWQCRRRTSPEST